MSETTDTAVRLGRLVSGFQVSQAIYVVVTLGIPDLLADGPRPAGELAREADAHPGALYRVLRALAAAGVLEEGAERTFGLTETGQQLRTDVPGSLAGWAAFVGRGYYWRTWGALLDSVKTGENTFRREFGESIWEYRARHPEESAIFDRAMQARSLRIVDSLLESLDASRFGTVVDVGGGNGALLLRLLEANPSLRGVLFDQPHVVSGADPSSVGGAVDGRFEAVGGSFFDSVPEGGDAYVLKAILHDWEDAEAIAILRTVRRAMAPGAVVLVIEQELGGPNERLEAKLMDLNMLVAPGGLERSLDEYVALFAAADLQYVSTMPLAAGQVVMEARAA